MAPQVDEYTGKRPLYEALRARVSELLETLLRGDGVDFHMVDSRTKTIDSFAEKISRAGKAYQDPLHEVTDLCGCRIIAYYYDDCEKIAELIKREFDVAEEELSHQPSTLDPDRFGYLSTHYVVKIRADRLKLPEWKAYKDLKTEIQVRTVIQHAWSAVSHALQYKEESKVPSKLQRRLYRIAGLFELADEEFIGIREQRRALQEEVIEAMSRGDVVVPLSITAISEFTRNWARIDELIRRAVDLSFTMTDLDEAFRVHSEILSVARKLRLGTLQELEHALAAFDHPMLGRFAATFKQRFNMEWQVTSDFLIFLLLIIAHPAALAKEDLIAEGWDERVADIVMETLGGDSSA